MEKTSTFGYPSAPTRYLSDYSDAERLEMAQALANATPQQLADAAKEVARTTTWRELLTPLIDGVTEGIKAALNDVA